MICKDYTKAGKKNVFTSGCNNFQRSALVHHMSQVDHKSSAKVLLCEQFPTFATLANIALIIPVSSASCERGFSCQNRIKTGLRNRLSEGHLENLMKVAIEGALLAESKADLQRAPSSLKVVTAYA